MNELPMLKANSREGPHGLSYLVGILFWSLFSMEFDWLL